MQQFCDAIERGRMTGKGDEVIALLRASTRRVLDDLYAAELRDVQELYGLGPRKGARSPT